MEIIERIFSIMEEKNLRPVDLAKYLGIRQSILSTWKSRKTNPPASAIMDICYFLEVSPEYLLTGTASENLTVFTSNETELIDMFRQLTSKDKTEVLEIMKIKLGYPKGRSYTSKTGKSGPENPDDSSVTA